jgi:hypothetical protein
MYPTLFCGSEEVGIGRCIWMSIYLRGCSYSHICHCKPFVANEGKSLISGHTSEQDQTLRSEDQNEYIVQGGKVDYRRE